LASIELGSIGFLWVDSVGLDPQNYQKAIGY
jgi:hypothetical protein